MLDGTRGNGWLLRRKWCPNCHDDEVEEVEEVEEVALAVRTSLPVARRDEGVDAADADDAVEAAAGDV